MLQAVARPSSLAETQAFLAASERAEIVAGGTVVMPLLNYGTDAFDTLGWIHYRRGEFAEAVTALQKAKTLAGGARPDIAAHLGLALAKAGRQREAAAELTFALNKGGPSLPNRAEVEKAAAALKNAQ